MKQPFKTTLLVLLIVFFWIPVLLLYPILRNIPRGEDAEATSAICREFIENAKTNELLGRIAANDQPISTNDLNQVNILQSPHRNWSSIYVYGHVSQQETQKLTLLSEKLALEHKRKIVLKFEP